MLPHVSNPGSRIVRTGSTIVRMPPVKTDGEGGGEVVVALHVLRGKYQLGVGTVSWAWEMSAGRVGVLADLQ